MNLEKEQIKPTQLLFGSLHATMKISRSERLGILGNASALFDQSDSDAFQCASKYIIRNEIEVSEGFQFYPFRWGGVLHNRDEYSCKDTMDPSHRSSFLRPFFSFGRIIVLMPQTK